jgi:hypothetical protein
MDTAIPLILTVTSANTGGTSGLMLCYIILISWGSSSYYKVGASLEIKLPP